MLREELQSYLDQVYPGSQIDTEHTLGGAVYIRFELGAELRNGTKKRVSQAVDRALAIFEDAFPDADNEIFVLVYDYIEGDLFNGTANYIYDQFPKEAFVKFYNKVEAVNTRYYISDKNGNETFEKANVKIVIGELPIKRINVRNILNGIANAEMDFEPRIEQRVFFFNPKNDKAFQMYDDRGCYIWSDKPGKISDIYNKRKDWIVEFDRPAIDLLFKQ